MTITRESILAAVQAAIEPLDYVHAFWSGGSAAFGRLDQWSDVDLHVDADDERVADAAAAVEAALAALAPIAVKYVIPQPIWHGHHQTFYQLSGADEFLVIDCAVMRHSSQNKFLEPEIHGRVVVHFDKRGVTQVPPLDRAALSRQLAASLPHLRANLEVFAVFTLKELHRGNAIEALAMFHNLTLRTLVSVLRLHYCPTRHNFHTRYVYYDLPAEAARRLEPFFFVGSPSDLPARHQAAIAWCRELLDELTPATLAQTLGVDPPDA